jgi:hypothetical protein
MIITKINEKREPKAFPKLLKWDKVIAEVYEDPSREGEYIGIHRAGPHAGIIVVGFEPSGGEDYNEPITIQNA